MFFDISKLDQKLSYKLLASTVVPRPIAWVITRGQQGQHNAAPFSFFNFFSGFPPTICLGIGRTKDSLKNIRDTGEFIINLVSEEMAEKMNHTATSFPPETSELDEVNIETTPASFLSLPRIVGSPVTLECRSSQFVDIDSTASLVIGHVLAVHVDDNAVINSEKCYIDATKLNLIGRMESPGWYTRTTDRFKLKQLSVEQWQQRKNESL